MFSPDGKKLFFCVNTGAGWARKYVEKTEAGWSAARVDGFMPSGSSSLTVSPDESFLLFSSDRPLNGDKEDMFIHVSFRKSDGTWSAPQRVSPIPGRFPSLSPDGKFLFFCGDDGNIYWADKKVLDPFRPVS